MAALSPAVIFWFLAGPLPQDQNYHLFVDDRSLFGIPNFMDVLSNLPFCLVGLWGVAIILGNLERFPFATAALFFSAGVFLTALGSAYYHWRPDNSTLVWDRLPITVAFTSFTAIIVFERISETWGRRLFVPLLAAGGISILVWVWRDDLRLYSLVQFYPIVAIPVILLIFKGAGTRFYWFSLLCYVLAKVLELLDSPVYRYFGGLISGHTLKHLVAGVATLSIILKFREQAKPR